MIDFTSTRSGVSPATAAASRLLAAVLAQAIEDAARPFSKQEKVLHMNLQRDVLEALEFLFVDPEGVFAGYASLIGTSADSIRTALMRRGDGSVLRPSSFNEMDRRTLQIRARLFLATR